MEKIQTTLEFLIIVGVVAVAAIIFGALYYTSVKTSSNYVVYDEPGFIESFTALNSTQDLIVVNSNISSNSILINFEFNIGSSKENSSISYSIINSSINQYGYHSYIIKLLGYPPYNPYTNSSFSICSLKYINSTRRIAIVTGNC